MRILLRDTDTGLFFKSADLWTAEAADAQSFRHSAAAMDLARQMRVGAAELLLEFGELQDNVVLSVPRALGVSSSTTKDGSQRG